jgi:HEAT repeat protein
VISLDDCIEKLQSEDEADRIYAAEDIGYSNQGAGVNPLLARLPIETSRAAREAIASALSQMDHDSVILGVLDWLDSEDVFLRNQAVEILAIRVAKAIPYLGHAFRCGGSDRRKFILDILARSGDPKTDDIYDLALSDPDLKIVIAAIENLGNNRKTSYRQRVENLLSPDAHPMLLCVCLDTLACIGDTSSLDVVRTRFGDRSHMASCLRPFYLKLLGAKGRSTDAEEIADMMRSKELEATALNALTALRARYPGLQPPQNLADRLKQIALINEVTLYSYQATRMLGALPCGPEMLIFFERCLNGPNKMIRVAAVQSLHEAGSKEADALIRRFLDSEKDEEVRQALSVEGNE